MERRGRQPKNFTPDDHVWMLRSPSLWQCKYCDGWCFSIKKPDEKAHAISEEKARSFSFSIQGAE